MEENKTSTWEEYRKRTHVIGRVVSAVTLVMLVGAPFLICLLYTSDAADE